MISHARCQVTGPQPLQRLAQPPEWGHHFAPSLGETEEKFTLQMLHDYPFVMMLILLRALTITSMAKTTAPAPNTSTNRQMSPNAMHAPTTWSPASARCCWAGPATPAWSP